MKHRDSILNAWIDLLSERRLLMGKEAAIKAELGHWLTLLEPAAEGDEATAHELYKLVAFHARQLGLEGRPASATVSQLMTLCDVLGDVPAEIPGIVHEMIKVAADAHALGQRERLTLAHRNRIRDASPVFQSDDRTVVAFMLGEMEPDNIDAITGRLLRVAACSDARTAVLDVSGADEIDDRFCRTVAGFLESAGGAELRLSLTGLRDVEATRIALGAAGVDLGRVSLHADYQNFLGAKDQPHGVS